MVHPCSDNVRNTLEKLSKLWESRAAVNSGTFKVDHLVFDPNKNDYSETLLPFSNHEAWASAPEEKKKVALSYAWGLYNLKTIYIECDVVTPSCEDFIKNPPTSSDNVEIIQDVMSEALLDEALHTRMSLMACNYIYKMRGIEPFRFTNFNLSVWKNELLRSCTSEGERRLARFAIACASETLITDYLKVMSEDTSIQTICHEVTRTHAEDEWSHSSVFTFVAQDVISGLSRSEKAFAKGVIEKTVELFADNEMPAWEKIFELTNFPYSKDILADSDAFSETQVYQESVQNLITRVGL